MSCRFAYKRFFAPFRTTVRTAHGEWKAREGVWVRLTDANGRTGYGEASPIPAFGTETVEEIERVCRSFGAMISPEEIRAVTSSHGCLLSALHAAQTDLIHEQADVESGQTKYLPVSALLPAGRGALTALASLADAGFRTFKWKVGVFDLVEEQALLDDLFSNLPTGAKLRLDANGAWTRRQAQRWLGRLADRPVEFVEQPVAADAPEAEDTLLGLAAEYPTALALDESVGTRAQIFHWLDLGWNGFLVLKPALIGNFTETFERIEKAHTRVIFSSALETAIGARAALRVALHKGEAGRAIGFGVWPLFSDSRFDGPSLAPFMRREDVERINPIALWNVVS